MEFNDNTDKCLTAIGQELEKRMVAAVNLVKVNVLNTLQGDRTGRRYKVPGTKDTYYTASAPGEPPASVTGDLRRSIDTDVIIEGPSIIGEVGTDTEYGPMLEYGTIHILPRPWLRPAFELSQEAIEEIFQMPMEIE